MPGRWGMGQRRLGIWSWRRFELALTLHALVFNFHSKAMELVQAGLTTDRSAVAIIEKFEGQFGIALPASVRELYSLGGVNELFKRISDDSLVRLEQAILPGQSPNGFDFPGLIRRGLFPFRVENQGV